MGKNLFSYQYGRYGMTVREKTNHLTKKNTSTCHTTAFNNGLSIPQSKRVFPTGGWLSCKRSDHFVLL